MARNITISKKIKEWFEKELGFESRITILGHIQRGGSPTVIERLRAAEFIKIAIENINTPNKIVTFYNDKFVLRDLKEILNSKYELDKEMIELAKPLMGV